MLNPFSATTYSLLIKQGLIAPKNKIRLLFSSTQNKESTIKVI
jgi:hypothetical protein